MRSLILVALLAATACGKEIGDECVVDSDCSSDGTRACDQASLPGHYCTVIGCDYNTCPDEATCISFFTGDFSNIPCESQDDCSLDELCSLKGFCVARSSEVRYCMRSCDSSSDCRDGYECRTADLMVAHGGDPVRSPDEAEALKNGTQSASQIADEHRFCASEAP